MSRINVLVVPPEGTPWFEPIEAKLDEFQRIVGGYIEHVSAHQHTAYVDEDGLAKQLPWNPVASSLLGTRIVGTALFIGDDGTEYETDVPEYTIRSVSIAARSMNGEPPDTVTDAVRFLRSKGYQVVEPRPDAEARVRRDAPDTSHGVEPKLGSQQDKVLTLLRGWNVLGKGWTDDEMEAELGLTHQSVSAARNTLVRRGLVYQTDERRLTRSGNKAIVWKAVER